ncbi:hypothetical protein JTB14_014843 [Gonioctena quinquepunctata]|nr:hypothetical protein JTB14_014843 [Gonioctena quinquepunctata]
MNAKIWKSSDDGKIDFISLTPEYLDESLEVLKQSFYCFEEVSIAIGLPGNEAAISELDELLLRTAFDGVSVIAIERNSNKVCGVAFNKIHVLDNPTSHLLW